MTLVSSDRDIHALDNIALVAASIPLSGRLGFAFRVGGFGEQTIVGRRGRLPSEAPTAPGVLAEVGVEFGVGPGLAGVRGDFDFFDAVAGVEGDALNFDLFASIEALVGFGNDEQRSNAVAMDRD